MCRVMLKTVLKPDFLSCFENPKFGVYAVIVQKLGFLFLYRILFRKINFSTRGNNSIMLDTRDDCFFAYLYYTSSTQYCALVGNDCGSWTTRPLYHLYQKGNAMSTETPLSSLGCWKDDIPRALLNVEGSSEILDGHYKRRETAVQKCFKASLSKGYKVFAVQDGGQCFGSNTDTVTYNKYGTSSDCLSDGEGGPWANAVYKIMRPNFW